MSQAKTLVSLIESKSVTTNVMAAAPTLAADGVSILPWRANSEFSGAYALVELYGDADATISAAGGDGVEIWGYRDARWSLIAELRDGRDITVGAAKGYAQKVNIIGVFERLAVVGTVSAGVTATAKLSPIEMWS